MKHLIKAQKIYSQIQSVDEEIKILETDLKNVINNDLTTHLEYTIKNKPKKDDILDEDGSIKLSSNPETGVTAWLSYANDNISYTPKIKNQDTNKKLDPSEFVVMFAALLKYKQETRKKLIEEFKKLELNLKL